MCAIFGVLDYKGNLNAVQRLLLVKALGTAAEVRGTDATGIAFFQRDRLCIQKAPKPAHRMKFRIPPDARYIMGHTRMTTQGSPKRNQNNHPFPGKAGGVRFALAHNGVLINDRELQKEYDLPKTSIETDSYVAVQLIERQGELSMHSIGEMAESLMGHFTFTILDQNGQFYFVKGDNPLVIFHYKRLGVYLYASTEGILTSALRSLNIENWDHETIMPRDGEILMIDRHGKQSVSTFKMQDDDWTYWHWCPHAPTSRRASLTSEEAEYIQSLKTVAAYYGYDEACIDKLLADGYALEDIEEFIYCQEEMM